MIYFVQEEGGGAIKIGFTSGDMDARLRGLQTGCSRKLHVLATIEDGSMADEKALHEMFAEHRVFGEWFKPHKDVLDYLSEISVLAVSDWTLVADQTHDDNRKMLHVIADMLVEIRLRDKHILAVAERLAARDLTGAVKAHNDSCKTHSPREQVGAA